MTPFLDWEYLTLRAHLHGQEGVLGGSPLSLGRLPGLWNCSEKTAKRHLKRLQAAGRVQLVSGRGRGNLSRISFSGDLQVEVSALVSDLAQAGDAAALARLSRLPFPRAWVLTAEVRALFGLTEAQPGVDRLRTVITRDLMPLDPLTTSATTEAHLLAQVLDPLVRFEAGSGHLQPHLAHHWQEAADGLSWLFHLRKGAAFHHGRTLDAGDVAFTLERLRAGAGWFLPDLRTVEVMGPFTVRLHLSHPDAFLPRRLADTQALILPRDVPFDPQHLIGTGAFRWTTLPEGFRLSAFDGHFAGRPLLDEIEVYRVEDVESAIELQVPGEEAGGMTAWQPEVGVQFMIWNGHRPAAQDAALRRGIMELHDIQAFWHETGQTGPLIPATSFYPRRSALKPPRVRSWQRAQAWLAQSTYVGKALHLWALDRPRVLDEAEWLAARAALFGVQLEIHPFEVSRLVGPDDPTDLVMLGEVAGADEHLSFWTAMNQPELLFRTLLPPEVLGAVDAELDAFRQPLSFAGREAIIDRVEALLTSGGYVNLTHHRVKSRQIHPLLRDVQPDAYGRINFKKLWIGAADTQSEEGVQFTPDAPSLSL